MNEYQYRSIGVVGPKYVEAVTGIEVASRHGLPAEIEPVCAEHNVALEIVDPTGAKATGTS